MRAPYYRVHIKESGRNISDRVEKFRFEDCVDEDNLFKIDVSSEHSLEMADDEDMVAGTVLKFQWGWAGGKLSKVHEAKISDIKTIYGNKVTLTITCLDHGNTMKKTKEQKVWKYYTASEIARRIAKKHGLTPVIDTTQKILWDIPQGNLSDHEFLNELAEKEEDDFIFYVRSGELHFKKRNLSSLAAIKFTYGFDNVQKISVEWKESDDKGELNSAESVGINPLTGEVEKKVGGKTGKALGEAVNYIWDHNGNLIKKTVGQSVDTTDYEDVESDFTSKAPPPRNYVERAEFQPKDINIVDQILNPETEPDNYVEATAEQLSKMNVTRAQKARLKALTVTIDIEGNPLVHADTIATISNVAQRHAGNWYVNKVVHDISKEYRTTITGVKDASKRATSKGSGSVEDSNKSVGESAEEEQWVNYDVDGIEVDE